MKNRTVLACISIALFAVLMAYCAHKPKKIEASWYGERFRGHTMSNGHPFNPDAMTCAANKNYAIGAQLHVTYCGQAVDVTVTDRTPLNRLDLSKAAFERLAPLKAGVICVQVK